MIKKVFNLSYLKEFKTENKAKEKSILCLESDYFNVFKFSIENVLNYEDRIEKIEDRLEILFPKYDVTKYILNYEIIDKNEDVETLLIYLLNIEKLNQENKNIFERITKFKIVSIIPNFLKAREYNKKSDFYCFDIASETLVISKYKNNIIDDIQFFHINLIDELNGENFEIEENYSNIINSFLDNIDENTDILFTGKNINLNLLNLENKNYHLFDIEKVNIKNYPNFLPKDIQQKYFLYYMNEKYLLILGILTIISSLLLIFLYFNIYKFEDTLSNLRNNKFNLEAQIEDLKKENNDLEIANTELLKEIEKNNFKSFKLNILLNDIFLNIPSGLRLVSIEYDDKRILNISGEADNPFIINDFLKNLQNSKNLSLENSDYIMKKENKYEFKFEIKYK